VGRGRQLVGRVAQVVLDLPERLALGEAHQPLGHLPQDRLGAGPQPAQQVSDAGLAAVVGGRGRGSR
jgi:hypothetical protein